MEQEFQQIANVDQARQAVRENVFYNVDVIKVTVGDDISVAEMTAIVEEGHRQHLKVAVHAIHTASIQTAIDGGADSIEHGNDVTDEQLKAMHDKEIFLYITPAFWGGLFTKIAKPTIVISPSLKATGRLRRPKATESGRFPVCRACLTAWR